MLLEPGPIAFLDPATTIAPPLTFGFEELATQLRAELEGARSRIDANASTMAGDLGSSPIAGLDAIVAAAASEHARNVGAGEMSLLANYNDALGLYDLLASGQAEYPPEGSVPSLPAIEGDPSPIGELNLPEGSSSGGDGDGDDGGGDDGGGDGGGSSGRLGTRELVELYMQENPGERARIERFLADNDNDWGRVPAALELPGWSEFVARHS